MITETARVADHVTRRNTLIGAAICLVTALLVVVMPFVDPASLYLIAGAMLLCAILPPLLDWQRGKFDAFETIHVLGLLYFIYFGAAAIWVWNDPSRLAYDAHLKPYLPKAALFCLFGYMALLVGYYGPWFRRISARGFEELPRSTLIVVVPGILGLVGSIAGSFMGYSFWLGAKLPRIFSSLAQLSPLYQFSWALGWLLLFSGYGTKRTRYVFLLVFVPATAVIILLSLADKSLVMTLIGVPVIALWYARRHLPWKTLVALLLLLVFVVFPFFNSFRLLDVRIPQMTRVQMTIDLMRHWDSAEYFDHSVVTVKFRMALINSVAIVSREVGRWIPYENGRTLFLPTLAYFIPAAIWPDKPTFALGREFGETFRVINVFDKKTSIAVTVPGELYWNFDLPGIVLGMGIWGVALRFLYRRYGEALGVDPVRRAIHILVMIQFVHFGGGIAAQSVTLIRTLVLLEIFLWLARRNDWLQPHRVSDLPGAAPAVVSGEAGNSGAVVGSGTLD